MSLSMSSIASAATPDDLASLEDQTSETLTTALAQHFNRKQVYVRCGPVTIALNPNDPDMSIYTEQVRRQFAEAVVDASDTHVYGTAEQALRSLSAEGSQNQTIVITGESGSGKTVTCGHILQYLWERGQVQHSLPTLLGDIEVVLGAFGNAPTSHNQNSSRYAKLVNVHFDANNTKVVGTSISASLLELGRVTAKPEATFHILRHVANDDQEELAPIDAALKSFGLDAETQAQVWSILRGIRHLVDGEQGPDKDSVGHAAEALGLKKYALSRALSHRVVRGIATTRSPEEVVAARYGLVRTLYGRLFEWLVAIINNTLKATFAKLDHAEEGVPTKDITVVDIFGFEQFGTNTLSQFLINWANEHLLQALYSVVLHRQREEYVADGIAMGEAPNLPSCTATLQEIARCLNDASKIRTATAGQSVQAFEVNLSKLKLDGLTAHGVGDFVVDHYAGQVRYTTTDFTSANAERVDTTIDSLLSQSTTPLVVEIAKGSEVDRRGAIPTIAASFSTSLKSLNDQLSSTQTRYIHCIKPNKLAEKWSFDQELVTQQVTACGIVQVARFARDCGPHRLDHSYFVQRFGPLLAPIVEEKALQAAQTHPSLFLKTKLPEAVSYLNSIAQVEHGVQLGKAYVYLNSGAVNVLQPKLSREHKRYVWIGQRARTQLARQRLERKRADLAAAIAKAKAEAEAKRLREEAEAKARAEAEERAKAEAEARAKAEAEAKARSEAEAKARAEAEARAAVEAEARAVAAEEARIKAEAEEKIRREVEAEQQKQVAEARERAIAEGRDKNAQAEARRRAEAEAQTKLFDKGPGSPSPFVLPAAAAAVATAAGAAAVSSRSKKPVPPSSSLPYLADDAFADAPEEAHDDPPSALAYLNDEQAPAAPALQKQVTPNSTGSSASAPSQSSARYRRASTSSTSATSAPAVSDTEKDTSVPAIVVDEEDDTELVTDDTESTVGPAVPSKPSPSSWKANQRKNPKGRITSDKELPALPDTPTKAPTKAQATTPAKPLTEGPPSPTVTKAALTTPVKVATVPSPTVTPVLRTPRSEADGPGSAVITRPSPRGVLTPSGRSINSPVATPAAQLAPLNYSLRALSPNGTFNLPTPPPNLWKPLPLRPNTKRERRRSLLIDRSVEQVIVDGFVTRLVRPTDDLAVAAAAAMLLALSITRLFELGEDKLGQHVASQIVRTVWWSIKDVDTMPPLKEVWWHAVLAASTLRLLPEDVAARTELAGLIQSVLSRILVHPALMNAAGFTQRVILECETERLEPGLDRLWSSLDQLPAELLDGSVLVSVERSFQEVVGRVVKMPDLDAKHGVLIKEGLGIVSDWRLTHSIPSQTFEAFAKMLFEDLTSSSPSPEFQNALRQLRRSARYKNVKTAADLALQRLMPDAPVDSMTPRLEAALGAYLNTITPPHDVDEAADHFPGKILSTVLPWLRAASA
ncbi:hypothetical protein Q8F55_004462 [Vanrija albida]|uniref:Myosin motor domain-containing protein n=1 Tax=Vanrija albida TaxID=181172 RepID=A0ABR3Q720_9TREE